MPPVLDTRRLTPTRALPFRLPPIAACPDQDGDKISIDAKTRVIDMHVGAAEMAARKAAFKAPPLKATKGTLFKYIQRVKSASDGCVTDE